MKTHFSSFALHQTPDRSRIHPPAGIERLESRIAPAFVASINGLTASFTGDASDENLVISANGATLAHNRFSAGDPGFASDLDFDSTTPGDQTFPSAPGATLIVELAGGNDSFSASGNIAAISLLQISGGPGNDILLGSNGPDVIRGGPGNDFIDGNQGNDQQFGGDGDDVIQWDPGDGSDVVEGGAGVDKMIFNGSNIGEKLELSANGAHLRLTRDVANIVMDISTVEIGEINFLAGTDSLTVGNLAATDVRELHVHLGAPFGATTPDGAVDTLSFTGSPQDDDIRVRSASASLIEITGLAARVQIDGFDTADILNVSGAEGVDNVVATDAARAKMVVNLEGEQENSAPPILAFATPASYDVGKSPGAIAAGHLFGEGRDLVVVNTKTNSLSVLFNAGDGTYLPAVQLGSGGKAPKSVVLEDFDGDGHTDIAVTNNGSATVAVLHNNGDGTFSAPALFATGKKPGLLHAADVNGDGNTDLVMITTGNKLSVLPGDGQGGFGAASTIATGGAAPVDFAFADFNGDGRLDLAIAHAGSANVTILTANADLTFGAPAKLRVGTKPSALAVGDFNGDGRADLAVVHSVSRFISLLLNTSTGSATTFNAQLKIAHPGVNAPGALAVADLDQDGRDDLIVGNTASGTLSILFNAGAASFRPALRIDLDNTPPRKTSALVVADLNGDGRLDIATANAGTDDLSLVFGLPG